MKRNGILENKDWTRLSISTNANKKKAEFMVLILGKVNWRGQKALNDTKKGIL